MYSIVFVELKDEVRLPSGHVAPPAGQAVVSKCPFLAAEIVQKNIGVVKEASMELQEDVQRISSLRTGKGTVKGQHL